MSDNEICLDCGHRWLAHHGRNGAERCDYRPYAGFVCPCRQKNPDIAAEDRLAAAAWNAYMGRVPREAEETGER
jgi:hypothetical protein